MEAAGGGIGMKLKIYIFTQYGDVIEVDAPTKAEAWLIARDAFVRLRTKRKLMESEL